MSGKFIDVEVDGYSVTYVDRKTGQRRVVGADGRPVLPVYQPPQARSSVPWATVAAEAVLVVVLLLAAGAAALAVDAVLHPDAPSFEEAGP